MEADQEREKRLRKKAMSLPLRPGVYLMKDKTGGIIYIGKAKALKNRVSSYFGSHRNHQTKVIRMVENVQDFDYIICDSEFEALVLECSLIKQHTPKYNILLKDDKGYHSVKVTQGPWSRIEASFHTDDPTAQYFGPYTSSFAVKETVEEVQKIFLLPQCGKTFPCAARQRPCLNFFIRQCSAPCAGKISQADYQRNVEQAIEFLRELNRMAFSIDPGLMMVAEESTAWPLVTRPTDVGGLGFNLKWNMGWMNDMCHYLKLDPWFRQFHHKDITFSLFYAFSENYVLPISHDEVVHMKGSLRGKMPGDDWGQLASVRGFTAYLYGHPGKQLTFMGAELGQWHEWDFAGEIDWYLLRENRENRQMQDFFRAINRFYLDSPELWEIDFSWEGFEWLVPDDNENNVVVFLRRDRKGGELVRCHRLEPI